MLFLGVDMGTSYFKVALFDEKGRLKGLGRKAVPVLIKGDKAELAITDFWNTLNACLQEALQVAGAAPKDICAVGYSSQANTFVLLDKQGRPLTPLILWTDKRDPVDEALLLFTQQDDWFQKTGLGIDFNAGFCINKCKAIQRNQPGLWEKAASVLTLSDYLIYGLTGEKITDHSTASLLGLLDIDQSTWWPEAMDAAALEKQMLASIVGIGAGGLHLLAVNPLGLQAGTKLYTGGLDHHMAAMGIGIGSGVQLSESTGTVIAAVLYSNSAQRLKNGCTARGFTAGHFFKMAFDLNGAVVLEWYRRTFAPEFSIEALVQMAEQVPSAGGLTALPRADLYDDKKGFLNYNVTHQHGHFVRSIMEATAKSLDSLINRVDVFGESNAIYATGGGQKALPGTGSRNRSQAGASTVIKTMKLLAVVQLWRRRQEPVILLPFRKYNTIGYKCK